MIEGIKTRFYKDVTMEFKAGMEFGKHSYKLKVIGKDIIRQYFDNNNFDFQVGRERIKRILFTDN